MLSLQYVATTAQHRTRSKEGTLQFLALIQPVKYLSTWRSFVDVGLVQPGMTFTPNYKTNQYGLAIDIIQAIDIVLLTGELVTADAQSNEDIF